MYGYVEMSFNPDTAIHTAVLYGAEGVAPRTLTGKSFTRLLRRVEKLMLG